MIVYVVYEMKCFSGNNSTVIAVTTTEKRAQEICDKASAQNENMFYEWEDFITDEYNPLI